MDYKRIIIIVLVFFFLAVLGFIISSNFINFSSVPTATIKNKTFKLLVARSEEDKQIGLSKHESLPEDSGMIFLFDKPSLYSFWMKDMKFAIDIIYIRGDRIVTIYENQKPTKDGTPPILTPSEPADKVLEINAGLSKKYNIKKGDKVIFKNL